MYELDRIDRKLLAELDRNSRQHVTVLAKRLRLGRDLVRYRVQKLSEAGVIRKFYAHLDPCKLGLTLYKMYLRLTRETAVQKKLIKFLEGHPAVHWVGQCGGSWDVIFAVCMDNPSAFYDFQNLVFARFSRSILDSDVAVIVLAGSFAGNFSLPIAGRTFPFGETPERNSLDQLEHKIVGHLCHDAQLDVSELAERVDSSVSTVRYRIERLEKMGVIRGYRVDVDLGKIGLSTFKAQLFLAQYSKNQDKALWNFCEKHPQITYLVYQLGHTKVEIEVEAKDYLEFESVIEQIEEAFPRLIHSVRSMVIYASSYWWRFSNGLEYVVPPAGEDETSS